MATPEPMLAWLRRKAPTTVVTRDMLDNDSCLAFKFLKAHGQKFDVCAHLTIGGNGWFEAVLNDLCPDCDVRPITARQAVMAINRAIKATAA